MPEDLEASARLAYETYLVASGGRNAAGLPMPMWEHVSVPERQAWLRVASAVTGISLPVPEPAPAPEETPPAGAYTQEELEALTVPELRELAVDADVRVASTATKQHLIDALLAHQGGTP